MHDNIFQAGNMSLKEWVNFQSFLKGRKVSGKASGLKSGTKMRTGSEETISGGSFPQAES